MSVTATTDVGQYQGPSRRVTSAEEMAARARALRRAAAAERSRRHRRGLLHRPSPLRVELAIPRGHVRADTAVSWLHDVEQHPDFASRRRDAQEHILAVARAIAAYARWESPDPDAADSWQRMTSRPGWETLKARTGYSRTTVANHVQFLRRAGLLGIVATGTTADLSPGVLVTADTANAAAVYVLMRPEGLRTVAVARPEDVGSEFVEGPAEWTPSAVYELDEDGPAEASPSAPLLSVIEPVDRSWTPSRSPTERSNPAYARARRKASGAGLRPALKTSSPMRSVPSSTVPDEPWPLSRRPTRKDEMLAAAAALQRALPVLGRISAQHLRSITRPLHLAGWTPADVLHAIARRPDGSVWHHGHDVAHVDRWLRHRLAPWHSEGVPRAPRSQQLAADAALTRAERRAAAEREATARRSAVPSPSSDPSWTAAKAAVRAQAAALRAARRARFLPPNA